MKIVISLLSVIIVLLVASCAENSPTNSSYKLTNIQYQNMLADSNWVEYTDTIYEKNIFPLFGLGDHLVIDSYEKMQEFFSMTIYSQHPSSADTVLLNGDPVIDFSRRTLLIYYFNEGGYSYNNKKLFVNYSLKKFRFVVCLVGGFDYGISWHYYAFTIPKQSGVFTFDFSYVYVN
jgi:hypothetical protein